MSAAVQKIQPNVKKSPGGVPYANPRIRVARLRLFSREEIEQYLHAPSFTAFSQRLGESEEYKEAYERALLAHRGIEAVNVTLQDELSRTYHWVYELTQKRYRKVLAALATKWDIADLKTVIRAKAAGVVIDTSRTSFVGVGVQIPPEELRALARQKTLEDVVDLALTWKLPYGKAFADGLEAYYLRESIADFELKLDHAYISWARKRFRRLGDGERFAREVFGGEVDKLNIATLVRLIDTADEVENPLDYFLEGGRSIDRKMFKKLMEAEDIYDFSEKMKATEYREPISEGYEQYLLTGHLSEFERALEKRLVKWTIKEGYHDVLGFGMELSYLTAKENETTNLGIIAHGVYRGVKPQIIERDLILV